MQIVRDKDARWREARVKPDNTLSAKTKRYRGILGWTLDFGSKGWGFNSRQRLAILSFSKTLYPHCCSPSRCINGDPVGCEQYVESFACNPLIGSGGSISSHVLIRLLELSLSSQLWLFQSSTTLPSGGNTLHLTSASILRFFRDTNFPE